jgi:hypothetical protein
MFTISNLRLMTLSVASHRITGRVLHGRQRQAMQIPTDGGDEMVNRGSPSEDETSQKVSVMAMRRATQA